MLRFSSLPAGRVGPLHGHLAAGSGIFYAEVREKGEIDRFLALSDLVILEFSVSGWLIGVELASRKLKGAYLSDGPANFTGLLLKATPEEVAAAEANADVDVVRTDESVIFWLETCEGYDRLALGPCLNALLRDAKLVGLEVLLQP